MDIENLTAFGELIRRRRKELRMTLSELAAVVPCSPRLLSELERGKRSIGLEMTITILNMLGMVLEIRKTEDQAVSEHLEELLNDLPKAPMAIRRRGAGLSLAGAQHKLPE